MYVLNGFGNLYALNAANGKKVWSVACTLADSILSRVTSPVLSLDNRTVYVGRGNHLDALDAVFAGQLPDKKKHDNNIVMIIICAAIQVVVVIAVIAAVVIWKLKRKSNPSGNDYQSLSNLPGDDANNV